MAHLLVDRTAPRNPTTPRDSYDTLPEDLSIWLGPARAVVERVEFNVGDAEAQRQLAGKGRLARA
jgi:hypothetical protein